MRALKRVPSPGQVRRWHADITTVKGSPAIPLARVLPARALEGAAAGSNLDNARRFYAGMSVTALFLLPVVVLFAPPDAHGLLGTWLISVAWVLGHLANAAWLLLRSDRVSWNYLLVTQYVDLALLAAMQALAGGWAAPYDQLMMVHMLAVGLAFVPRRSLPYLAFAIAAALSPIAYGETHGRAGEVVIMLWLWSALALFGVALMARIRRQRLALADEARVDALTQLENRRAFEETIGAQLTAARAAVRPLVLGIGDVDRFKAINDRHGHQAGDVCLRAVAAALRGACRQGDRVFRWGGDEFAIVLEGATDREVAGACRRLQETVAAAIRDPDGEPVRLTIGWALDDGRGTADELVAAADASLLARKAPRDERDARVLGV